MRTEDHKFDFIRATVRAEHPTWTETQVFEQSIVQAKLGSFGRPKSDGGAVLVAEAKDGEKPAPKPDEVVEAYHHPFAAEAERRG